MRSGTSFFDWTVFKKTILRFWPVWTSYFIIWFVPMPLNALMMLQQQARSESNFRHLDNFATDVVAELHQFALFMAIVFGVLAAMAVCSHLYNARSANFFGVLPIRREGLFLIHYTAGLAFLIVPNLVIFLLTLIVEVMGGALYLTGLLFWLAVACGECFFFYSMAVFCGMFTGHILALPAFYAIFNGIVAVLYYLMNWVLDSFYYGFASYASYEDTWRKAAVWCTPLWKLYRGVGATYYEAENGIMVNRGPYGLDIVAVYAVVALALTLASFLLYRARRLESAGDVVSVRPMRPVFKYGVSVCSGLCLGMITSQIVYMHEPGMMLSILAWSVIGYFVAQMLLDKTFWVFRKWKGAAAVAGVFIVLFIVVGFDLTGFETRIPTVDQVESVEFDGTGIYLGDDGDYLYLNRSDPEYIGYAVMLHQTAVSQRDFPPGGNYVGRSMTLTYHLKNGSAMARQYTLWVNTEEMNQEGTPSWFYQQVYSDRALCWEVYGFAEADRRAAEEGYWLEQVVLTGKYDRDTHVWGHDSYFYGKDAQALYDAVREDFFADRVGVRTKAEEGYDSDEMESLQFKFVNQKGYTRRVRISVQDTASGTLQVLERLEAEGAGGYVEPTQPEGNWIDTETGSVYLAPTVSAQPADEPAAG